MGLRWCAATRHFPWFGLKTIPAASKLSHCCNPSMFSRRAPDVLPTQRAWAPRFTRAESSRSFSLSRRPPPILLPEHQLQPKFARLSAAAFTRFLPQQEQPSPPAQRSPSLIPATSKFGKLCARFISLAAPKICPRFDLTNANRATSPIVCAIRLALPTRLFVLALPHSLN